MSRVFDTYRKPDILDGARFIAACGSAIYLPDLSSSREFCDMAFLAPEDRPMLFLQLHCRLLYERHYDVGGYVEPDNTGPSKVPILYSAAYRIQMRNASTGALISTSTPSPDPWLSNTTLQNNMGQHTIPAGGIMLITLRAYNGTAPTAYAVPSFSAYVRYGEAT